MPDGAPGSAAARCSGKFNRPKNKKPYHKPERLYSELVKLFDEKPVLTPHQAYLRLREMRQSDGSRTFSIRQAGSVKALAKGQICPGCKQNPCKGCRGKLITPGEIKSFFSSLARKRKNESKVDKIVVVGDGLEAMTVPQLKEALKKAGKTASGKKADLVARLRAANEEATSASSSADKEDDSNTADEAAALDAAADLSPRKRRKTTA